MGRNAPHRAKRGGSKITLALTAATPLTARALSSVDVLFDSAAKILGGDVLGVVLTGMGSDGVVGSRTIARAGRQLLVEAESSCVVYGMPRVVAEANLSADSAPLELMVCSIIARV